MSTVIPTISVARTAHLTRWNAALLARNRAALFYAVVMPLLPLGLMALGERGNPTGGANAVTTAFLVAGLFPVYYNVLSQFVGRRDELVLKRMRTGQTKDLELLVSIALPGAFCALLMCALALPIAAAFGQSLPVNPVIYALLAVLAVTMFTAFAYWTAAWTRSAEAAQLTSMPIIFLVSLGPLAITIPSLSEGLQNALSFTPGAAMADLLRSGWFGFDGAGATDPSLTFADTWSAAGGPLLVIVAWTAIAISLARRSMVWEPRS
ncbi:MAG: ABC transporter permease [Solirubrobacteraceae bacterium]|nr:ABC transporter permease [Solirubrobacteraceae bacterium]